MVLVFVLIWVKSVLRCSLYIFHLSGSNPHRATFNLIKQNQGNDFEKQVLSYVLTIV